jgi:hypothetical protein
MTHEEQVAQLDNADHQGQKKRNYKSELDYARTRIPLQYAICQSHGSVSHQLGSIGFGQFLRPSFLKADNIGFVQHLTLWLLKSG